jgi:hypothetical protein
MGSLRPKCERRTSVAGASAADDQQKPTRPDPLHPVHRHDVAGRELAIGRNSRTVAIAMRQKQQCRRSTL